MSKIPIGGMIEIKDLTLIEILGIPNEPDSAGQYLTLLGNEGINLHFISEGEDSIGKANITACVDHDIATEALGVIHNFEHLPESVIIRSRPNVMAITVYGPHFREKPAICSQMCHAIGQAGVNILGISSSISSVCCVISSLDYDRARASLLNVFQLP